MKNFRVHAKKSAFTLVELLVSLALFIVFLGILSTSYVGVVRAQKQANSVRKMYVQVRTFMETLAQDVRLGTIDYDCYENIVNAANANSSLCPVSMPPIAADGGSPYLALVNMDKTEKTVYWFDNLNHVIKLKKFVQTNGVWASAPDFDVAAIDGGDGFQTMLSADLKVENLIFAIYPAVNPYSHSHYSDNQFQFQPKVTVFVAVKNSSSNLPPFELHLQTSFSSRVYSRK